MKNTKATIKMVITLFALSAIFLSNKVHAQQVSAEVTNLRSSKGTIVFSVFNDEQSYDKLKPHKKFVFDKKRVADGRISFNLGLPPGNYGITILDDENDNGKMDNNFIGMPKEGFGFSNFFMEKLKKPNFEDFKISVKSADKITFKIKYL